MEKRIENISVSIASVYRGIQKSNSEALSAFGMNNIHSLCIYAIGSNPGISATGICKSTASDKAAVSKAIRMLIEKGYLERPLASKRAYRSGIYLTDKGQELFEIVSKKFDEISSIAFKNINDKDYKTLLNTLKNIESNLEKGN